MFVGYFSKFRETASSVLPSGRQIISRDVTFTIAGKIFLLRYCTDECFHFLVLYASNPLKFRGKFCTLNPVVMFFRFRFYKNNTFNKPVEYDASLKIKPVLSNIFGL